MQLVGEALDIMAAMRGRANVADTWEMRILFKGMEIAQSRDDLSDYCKVVSVRDYALLRVAQHRETERTRTKKK